MLIIGHRGAAGSAPENTLEALRHGFGVGADILEFDVQVTRDKVPIVIHDSNLLRTHKKATWVRWSKHESIARAAARGHKIALLDEVLDEFFGRVLLNLELKSRFSAPRVLEMVEQRYVKKEEDWENILFSSFYVSELAYIRKHYPHAPIALLHNRNPFAYITQHRNLQFDAVGFNRLYMNALATKIANNANIFTYAYTVNRPDALRELQQKGIDAAVTDYPQRMVDYLKSHTSV